ncbi:hypothetical protein E0198_003215 [Clavispora lusitaniae]|nr:hypothetical protein E0198_003215 [Clavispora lusitaniae]
MNTNEPPLKKVKIEKPDHSDFEEFITQIEKETEKFSAQTPHPFSEATLDEQIEYELFKLGSYGEDEALALKQEQQDQTSSSRDSPCTSTFEEEGERVSSTSVSSPEEEENIKKGSGTAEVNPSTVATLKRAMCDTSRLIGTFTTLKTTYLKLCKEFNYLLGKFNQNERIKIELIHENNELRKLLVDVIKEKEMDRKRYKDDIEKLKAQKSCQVPLLA